MSVHTIPAQFAYKAEAVDLPADLPRSRPISVIGDPDGALDYIAYVPENARKDAPLLVCVHGIKRNPAEQVFRFARHAERMGVILLAPHFTKKRFRRYQTLAPDRRGNLPEVALDHAIDDWIARSNIRPQKLFLFGFSGGAQFIHRYAMLGRRKIDAMAVASPGWFTLPDRDLPYPFGTGPSEKLGTRVMDESCLLETPTLVLVGERDTARNPTLNTNPIIERTQGLNRVERASTWNESVRALRAARMKSVACELRVIERATHSFSRMMKRQKMGEVIFDWLNQLEGSDRTDGRSNAITTEAWGTKYDYVGINP